MIEHILWDWNGTLLDDAFACVESLNAMLRQRGMAEVTCEQYREVFGFPVYNYYVQLGFDFRRDDWKQIARDFHALYLHNAKRAELRPGVVETLTCFHDRGMPMSILSASETSILEAMVAERGIRHFFTGLHGLSDLFAHSKLDVGRRMMGEAGVAPVNLLLVGDTIHDFEVATDVGCRCVLLSCGHQAEWRLRACGCDVLPDVPSVVDYVDCGIGVRA